jgi:hypothetical protein
MWTEDLATDERKLKSYAVGGATVDRTLWSARVSSLEPPFNLERCCQRSKLCPCAQFKKLFSSRSNALLTLCQCDPQAQNTDMVSHVDTFINQDSSVETES